MAAVLACGDGALLSHWSAAWLWGLATKCGREIDVTISATRRRRPGIRTHSSRTIAVADRAENEGIPLTAVPRTLLDVAAVSPRYLRWMLSRAQRLGQLDLIAIDSLLQRRQGGDPGVSRLELALLPHRTSKLTKSDVERDFLALIERHGLPRPVTNLFIAGYELDAFWEAERFAVELDTYEYHGDPEAFEKDRLRQVELKLAGIEMISFTGIQIETEPAAVASRLRRLLRQRHRDLGLPES